MPLPWPDRNLLVVVTKPRDRVIAIELLRQRHRGSWVLDLRAPKHSPIPMRGFTSFNMKANNR
jgi:hypothetical protein